MTMKFNAMYAVNGEIPGTETVTLETHPTSQYFSPQRLIFASDIGSDLIITHLGWRSDSVGQKLNLPGDSFNSTIESYWTDLFDQFFKKSRIGECIHLHVRNLQLRTLKVRGVFLGDGK